MIRATTADQPAITAFLQARAERAMFQLANLASYGMQGGHDRAMNFWLSHTGVTLTDVLAITDEGMVMPTCPTGNWPAAAAALAGRRITGVIGPAEQARPLIAALGLREAATTLDDDEPQFTLPLSDLHIPKGPGTLVPLADAPEATIRAWMLDYQLTALNAPLEEAKWRTAEGYTTYCANRSHTALIDAGEPISMTGFNARIDGIVQIGGVYTPPSLRGRGYARRAVALHLQQAAAEGITRATLFASGDQAVRAYRAIGFEQIGRWTLMLLAHPQKAQTHG